MTVLVLSVFFRGFGFVTYKDPNSVEKVISSGPHMLDSKTVWSFFYSSCFCLDVKIVLTAHFYLVNVQNVMSAHSLLH